MMKKIIADMLTVAMLLVMLCPVIVSYAALAVPISLEVQNQPKITEYCVGDEFDTRGLSFSVKYSDDSINLISSGYNVEYDFSTAGAKCVNVSYTENGETVNTSLDVNVYENPVITAGADEVCQGETVTVPISISQNCGLMGIELLVSYDADIFTPISVSYTDIFSTGEINDSIETSETNMFSIIWSGTEKTSDNGKLCDVTFLCNRDAIEGESVIFITANPANTYTDTYASMTCVSAQIPIVIIEKDAATGKRKLKDFAVTMEDYQIGQAFPAPVIYGNLGNGNVQYTYSDKASGPYTITQPLVVGTYFLKATVAATDKYEGASSICSYRVLEKPKQEQKAQLDNFTVVMDDYKFGQTAPTPMVYGNKGKGKVTYTYASKASGPYTSKIPVNIGKYYLKATVAETNQYNSAVSVCSFNIKKPEIGDTFTQLGAVYRVMANNELTYVKNTSKAAVVIVPDTVKVGTQTYKVTAIGKKAFNNNKTVTNVKIGKYVISIGQSAFKGCSKLSKVTLGKGVKIIGNYAFYKCTSLKKITITSNVTELGKRAFYGDKKLKTITIKSKKLKDMGQKAFYGIHKKAVIKVPSSKRKAYKKLFTAAKGYRKTMKIK